MARVAGNGAARERRQHRRRPGNVRAQISNPTFGSYGVAVRDISDNGLFVELGSAPAPPVGTPLRVEFVAVAGELPREPLHTTVVRHDGGGVGLVFNAGRGHSGPAG